MAFLILQPPLAAFLSTPDTALRVRLFDMQAELCHSLVQIQQQSLLDEPGSHQHFFQVRFCSRAFEYFSETFFFQTSTLFHLSQFPEIRFSMGSTPMFILTGFVILQLPGPLAILDGFL